mgnify:CR=1 FL=1
MFSIKASFEYAFLIISRLGPPPPDQTWAVCASYPDQTIKHIWLAPFDVY